MATQVAIMPAFMTSLVIHHQMDGTIGMILTAGKATFAEVSA